MWLLYQAFENYVNYVMKHYTYVMKCHTFQNFCQVQTFCSVSPGLVLGSCNLTPLSLITNITELTSLTALKVARQKVQASKFPTSHLSSLANGCVSVCASDLDVHMLRGVMLLNSHSLPYSVIKFVYVD